MLSGALMGFERAYQRFLSKASGGAAPENVFVPLSEALWWIVSVDDGFADLAQVDTFRTIFGSLGLPVADFETKANLVDRSLCDIRNAVAHGRDAFPPPEGCHCAL